MTKWKPYLLLWDISIDNGLLLRINPKWSNIVFEIKKDSQMIKDLKSKKDGVKGFCMRCTEMSSFLYGLPSWGGGGIYQCSLCDGVMYADKLVQYNKDLENEDLDYSVGKSPYSRTETDKPIIMTEISKRK